MIGTTIGNYRIEHPLSEGGMSSVFLGRTIAANAHLPAGLRVVIKILSAALAADDLARRRFIKEAEILSRMHHRFITRFHEFVGLTDRAVLILEYVHGEPVDLVVSRHGALPPGPALQILESLLEALSYAHSQKIVHRDIKPANLIRLQSGEVKVTDFGIAKFRQLEDAGQLRLTRDGFLLGTPHYMSPEQMRDPANAGEQSDIYSAGVVLYELLTGVVPFNSSSLPLLVDAVYRGEKHRPRTLCPAIPSMLEDVILRAMNPAPERRFQTAEDFMLALAEFRQQHRNHLSRDRAMIPSPSGNTLGPKIPISRWRLIPSDTTADLPVELSRSAVMIGRERGCSMVLAHPGVSRRHALMTVTEDGILLEDLNSSNGTYVNNTRVRKQTLTRGDVIRFGSDLSCSFIVQGS